MVIQDRLFVRIILHIGFWIIALLLRFLPHVHYRGELGLDDVFHMLIVHFYIMVVVYGNLLLSLPLFLKKKKFFLLGLVIFLSMILMSGINVLTDRLFDGQFEHISYEMFRFVLTSFVYLSIISAAKFMGNWIKSQNLELKLRTTEQEKLNAELQLLKAQLNPHFLFNTLNNIYSLSLDLSVKTSEYILKLSDLISYILYECKEDYVSLEKEIDFLRNYIELERIRLEEGVDIQFDVKGDCQNKKVAPLLFVPFVENAFKHALNRQIENAYLKIVLSLEGDNLSFMCENTTDKSVADLDKRNGIGLENVRKRLELQYPEQHKLNISDENGLFRVDLSINIYLSIL